MSSEALLSEGLKRALPDDQLGQAAHLQRLAEQSEWNLTRVGRAPSLFRRRPPSMRRRRRSFGNRTENDLGGIRLPRFPAQSNGAAWIIPWVNGVGPPGCGKTRAACTFRRMQDSSPDPGNGPGTHRQVQRLLESWEVVLNGLGESLRWKERESSTRGGGCPLA